MANWCLVTKLKGIVNNNSLSPLGVIRVDMKTSESENRTLNLKFDRETTICLSNGTFSNGEKQMTIPANTVTPVVTSNNAGTLYIPKYGLLWMYNRGYNSDVYNVHLEDFEFVGDGGGEIYLDVVTGTGDASKMAGTYECLGVTSSGSGLVYGDISKITITDKLSVGGFENISGEINVADTVTELSFVDTKASLDLSKLAGVNIHLILGGTEVRGDIINVANTSLTRYVSYSPEVTGSIEAFVEKLWADGKRSGDIAVNFATTRDESMVTFNGYRLDAANITFAESSVTVSRIGDLLGVYDGTSWTYSE